MATEAVKMLDEVGMDTNIVGELVRRALEADEFYIFTSIENPPSREMIEVRTKEIFISLGTLDDRLREIRNEKAH